MNLTLGQWFLTFLCITSFLIAVANMFYNACKEDPPEDEDDEINHQGP